MNLFYMNFNIVVGQLKEYVRSQIAPKDNYQRLVKIVVGKTFDSFVNTPKKDVLISFVSQFCKDCEQFEKKFNELAKKYNFNKDLLFGKIDQANNDIPELFLAGFDTSKPSLYFLSAEDKSNPVLFIDDQQDDDLLEDLVEFIEQQLSKKQPSIEKEEKAAKNKDLKEDKKSKSKNDNEKGKEGKKSKSKKDKEESKQEL
jgi:thiol-disulfide isomerase/thioredoxin